MRDNMEWREIPGTQYEVSECGDVRRRGVLDRLRGYINSDGYITYKIEGEHRTAHRLVALAFLPAPEPGQVHVAHRDGSRLHCHWSNLLWSTPADNRNDCVRHGTGPAGERNPKAKLTEDDVCEIRREYELIKMPGSGRKVSELEEAYGVSRSAICDIASGRTWAHVRGIG